MNARVSSSRSHGWPTSIAIAWVVVLAGGPVSASLAADVRADPSPDPLFMKVAALDAAVFDTVRRRTR